MAEVTVYCTRDDVQRWVKRVQFSDTSKVTPSDVDFYIQSVSNRVDGYLRNLGVTLPIVSGAKVSLEILKILVSFEAASLAEQAAFFGTNKNESAHGKWLHDQYLELLSDIQANPSMLSDLVTSSVRKMESDTEDMNEGGTKEGDEIFTKKHIDDFRDDYKQLSPSEKDSTTDTITGVVPRTRV